MFREIESIYKKESPYNKIVKTFIVVYFLSFVLLWVFGLFKKPYFAVIFVLGMICAIKIIIEQVLDKKISIKSMIKYNGQSELLKEIEKKEIKIMKNYLNKNRINNNICITNIIEYYRNKTTHRENSISIVEFINIFITILVPFINGNGIDTELLKNTFPYFLTLIIIIILIFTISKWIFTIKKDLKGEYYMYEKLEEIFSIILCENNKDQKVKKDKDKKKKRPKW